MLQHRPHPGMVCGLGVGLVRGNERFAVGAPRASQVSEEMRRALEKEGQQPHSAILGCADSRVPIGTVFDAPGHRRGHIWNYIVYSI